MQGTIPLYTTDQPPIPGQRVVAGSLEWCQKGSVGEALNALASSAIANGANAVVGVRMVAAPSSTHTARYVAYGTAVAFG